MRLVSYQHQAISTFGAIDKQDQITDLGGIFKCENLAQAITRFGLDLIIETAQRSTPTLSLQDISAYRPVVADPPRIFCVGLNYEAHRLETKRSVTAYPTIFLRCPSSQVGHRQALVCPLESDCLDYEGEIAIVIGQAGRRIKPEHAWRYIAGLSAYNDASVRDWQAHSTQWTQGKNFPATGAFGPQLVMTDEVGENDVLTLTTSLNGNVMQSADTSMMLFPIPELIAYISTFTELMAGDVIVTGTPGGVGFKMSPPVFMNVGDEITVDITQVGTLSNPVYKESTTV